MKTHYLGEDGWVEGELLINGVPFNPEQSPFFKAVAKAEWDLIARYDRGEVNDNNVDNSADDR